MTLCCNKILILSLLFLFFLLLPEMVAEIYELLKSVFLLIPKWATVGNQKKFTAMQIMVKFVCLFSTVQLSELL